MIALLALAAAAGWGSSDFAAGVASRRATALSVVILTHLTATIALAVVSIDPDMLRGVGIDIGRRSAGDGAQSLMAEVTLPAFQILGSPSLVDIGWGALAGVSGGVGALLLYRGLAKGSMAVVAPITAAGAAAIPAVFGLLTGDAASPLLLGGIALALLGITLVSSVAPAHDEIEIAAGPPLDTASGWRAVPPSLATTISDDELVARALRAIDLVGPAMVATRREPSLLPFLVGAATAVIAGAVAAMTTNVLLGQSGPPTPGVFLAAFGAVALASAGATGVGALRLPRSAPRAPTSDARSRRRNRLRSPGVPDALGSGVGFACFFILSAHAGGNAGLWPMVTARGTSVVMFTIAALMTRSVVLPARGTRRTVLLAGLADAAAAGLFLISTRSGSLSVVSVLSSMYPAVTVVLARVVTKERCTRLQLAGLGVAATAVGLIAVG